MNIINVSQEEYAATFTCIITVILSKHCTYQ